MVDGLTECWAKGRTGTKTWRLARWMTIYRTVQRVEGHCEGRIRSGHNGGQDKDGAIWVEEKKKNRAKLAE